MLAAWPREEDVLNTPAIGSLLLASDRPEALRRWYRDAFGAVEGDMEALEFGAMQVFIEMHSEVQGPTQEPARCIINLNVSDCLSVADRLKAHGARFIREVESQPFGLIATVADPDGNYVQIIQWGAAPESHVQ